jgi:hypothetical protein
LPSPTASIRQRLDDRADEPGSGYVAELQIQQFTAESIEPSGWSYRNIFVTGAIRNTSRRTLRGVTYWLYSSGVKVKEGTLTIGPNTTTGLKAHFPTCRGRKLKLKLVVSHPGMFGRSGLTKCKEIDQ